MPRSACLLLAAVLLLVAAAPAGADARRTGQSPAEVAAYWSKDRMNGAVPRERSKPVAAKAGGKPGGSASWTSLAVPLPYSGANLDNGKVFFTENGVDYVCSGTSVATTSGSLVWTAGHCVNEGPGDYVTNFMFAPGWVDGTAPYGKWAATQLATTSQWAGAGDYSYDVGAARVVPGAGAPPSGTLSQIATPRAMAFNYAVTLDQTTVRDFGYPAAGRFNGQRQWECDSPITRRDGTAADAPMAIGCDMNGGSSGGGWMNAAGAVASVNSYYYNGLKTTMFGPYQGTVAQALYTSMR